MTLELPRAIPKYTALLRAGGVGEREAGEGECGESWSWIMYKYKYIGQACGLGVAPNARTARKCGDSNAMRRWRVLSVATPVTPLASSKPMHAVVTRLGPDAIVLVTRPGSRGWSVKIRRYLLEADPRY